MPHTGRVNESRDGSTSIPALLLWLVTFWAPLVFVIWFNSGELLASMIAAALVVSVLGALALLVSAVTRIWN